MKKLMFAVAAVAAMVAVAEEVAPAVAQVKSQTVGFSASDLDNEYGAVLIGAQFGTCSATEGKIALKDVTPTPGGELVAEDLNGNVTFQLLNDWGGDVEGSTRVWDGAKWTLEDGTDMSEETYIAGQGLWVYNYCDPDVGGVTFQSKGQVNTEDIVFKLDDEYGAVSVANTFPVKIKLSKIVPEPGEGVTADDLSGNVTFQKLNDWGGDIEGSTRVWDGSKWTLEDGTDASNDEIDAGEALWVYNYVDPEMGNVYLRIPAPELD